MVRWTDDDPGAGEVDELENLARRVDTLAEQMWHTGQDVRSTTDPVSEGAWAGQAGDEWRGQVERALPPLQTVVDVAVDTSAALTTYARHIGEIASEAVQVWARHEDATAATTAAMAQLTLIDLQAPVTTQMNNMVTDQRAMKKTADKRRIANASLEDAQDDKRAAERDMEELADRRRNADRRVIEALGPVEVSEWEHIGQAVITAGFTSPGKLGKDPMGAAMVRLSAGVYSGTADQATGDMAVVMSYRLLNEWMKSRQAQTLVRVGRENTSLLNEMLAGAIAHKEGGRWGKVIWTGIVTIFSAALAGEAGAALDLMNNQFKPNGPWDAKMHLRTQFGIVNEASGWLPMGTGEKIYYDVFGNIKYGSMMRMFGVSLENAIDASHVDGTGQPGEGEADDPFIRLGYGLLDEFPDGMSEEEFGEWFNGAEVREVLEATGRIQ